MGGGMIFLDQLVESNQKDYFSKNVSGQNFKEIEDIQKIIIEKQTQNNQ